MPRADFVGPRCAPLAPQVRACAGGRDEFRDMTSVIGSHLRSAILRLVMLPCTNSENSICRVLKGVAPSRRFPLELIALLSEFNLAGVTCALLDSLADAQPFLGPCCFFLLIFDVAHVDHHIDLVVDVYHGHSSLLSRRRRRL